MISRPARLEDWTLDLVRDLASSGAAENDWYDLKGQLQQADHQRKVVAALANTRGGFLVFGVTDDRQVVGVRSAELPRDFASKLTSSLNPSVSFEFAPPLSLADASAVWICEVHRSQRGPHGVFQNDHWVFPKRTEAGTNVTMSVEEVRIACQETDVRRGRLMLLLAEVRHLRQLVSIVVAQAGRYGPPLWAIITPPLNPARVETLATDALTLWASNATQAFLVPQLRDATLVAESERIAALQMIERPVSGRHFGQGARHVLAVVDQLLPLLVEASGRVGGSDSERSGPSQGGAVAP